MSIGWVASSVRARAMTRRRLGRAAARNLATRTSVDAAVAALVHSPYGHDVRAGQDLAQAQRAVVQTALWNVRVLSGWVPREGVSMLRTLLGALEVANVEDHVRLLGGADVPAPYRLGGLGTAWSRVAATTSVADVRHVLAASAWGDPGGDTVREIGLAMRASLADRVIAAVPPAGEWAAGASALLLARQVLLERRPLPAGAQESVERVLGPAAIAAATLNELTIALPKTARWALADVRRPADLWLAEAHWWRRVEHDGFALLRRVAAGPETMVGALALLAADAWRVRAALESAARAGTRLEVFDAMA